MKKLLTLTSVLAAVTIVIVCVSTTTTAIAAPSQKEVMLQQAGFKIHAVTTARQKQHLQALPEGRVSIVQQNGKTFYAYPDVAHNQVYTGNEAQYQAYKQVQLEASRQNREFNIDPDPQGIRINEFDGFGPLGGDER